MRSIVLASTIFAMALVAASAARADFRFGPSPEATTAAPQSGPPMTFGSSSAATTSRFKTARGFGRAIPLGFAVRQIVPAAVVVRYGPGVDQNRLVNWSGDAPWNQVLDAAVHPLGLRLFTGELSVLISR